MTQIDRLLLLAGPSTAGKSTLIKSLQSNERLEELAPAGIGDPSQWAVSERHGVEEVLAAGARNLLYHFDIFAPWKAAALNHGDSGNPLLELIENAGEVTCLTLWVQPAILAARIEERRATAGRKKRERMDVRGGYRLLMDLYRDPQAVIDEYDAWFQQAASLRFSQHWIVDNSHPTMRLYPLGHWRDMKSAALGSS